MDVLFSPEAFTQLKALSSVNSPASNDGLLIGHRQGPAHFIEKILPTSRGFFPSLERYHSLQDLFQDKIIGFFTFTPDEKKKKKILAPFACGKLYLEIEPDRSGQVRLKTYLIDYEKAFFLSPLRFQRPRVKA